MDDQRRLEQLARASRTDAECPAPEQLAAYILGLLEGAEQLRLAAHVRNCPFCQDDVAAARPPEPRRRTVLARLTPLTFAEMRRAGSSNASVRQYVAADLVVMLTVPPPRGEVWRVTGQIVRQGQGIAERTVTLRSGRRRYQQQSDEQGFFTFAKLPTGSYTLSVSDERVEVQIRDLDLRIEEA